MRIERAADAAAVAAAEALFDGPVKPEAVERFLGDPSHHLLVALRDSPTYRHFDPETVADRATFEDPLQFPIGIRDVLVGGVPVVRDAEMTGARPGKVVN